MNIHELIEARARLWEQMKAALDTAKAEGRADSGEVEASYRAMSADLNTLDARIAEASDLAQRADAAAELAAKYAPKPEQKSAPADDASVLRKMANGELRSFEFGPQARDLTKGTATAGGNVVPTSFYASLQEHLIEMSSIRQSNVQVITTASGENLDVPKTTAYSTAAIISEGGTITESDPAFGKVTLGAWKYGISIQVSSELEQDKGVDLAGFLVRQAARALANGSNGHFVAGDGSSKPNGILTASTAGVTGAAAAAGVFTADNLLELQYSVIAPYRRNGYWMLSDAGLLVARKLKDSDGQYLWTPGLVAGENSTLLGRPVLSDPNMPDPAADAKSVLFGDFSSYMIRDVAGVRVERSADFAFDTDLVTWRFIMRTDGDLVDTTGAVKHFVGGAAA